MYNCNFADWQEKKTRQDGGRAGTSQFGNGEKAFLAQDINGESHSLSTFAVHMHF